MRSAEFVLLLLGSAVALGAQTPSLRVLFLGNSLTDGNDVPSLVQAMAKLEGVTLVYTAFTPGGYALEDHWRDNRQALLRQQHFDVLILQQGPSTLPDSQLNLTQWATTWADEARRHGTLPALYMVWPVRGQAGGFALVSQSYRNAAVLADAAILPAGEVWETVLEAEPSTALYANDGLHATPSGSFLAAMVLARGLVALDPAKVPAQVDGVAISTATLARFRTAVAAIEARSLVGSAAPAPPAPNTPSVNPPPPPAPAAPPGGGGGGASSLWFLFAVALTALVRLRFGRPETGQPFTSRN